MSLPCCILLSLALLCTKLVISTIDINAAELQYLSDHLTPEECRRLVAAAHYKSYQEPNALDQAERKISKDIPCIDLLHHWNSEPGEGKGETHEVLEHRLRQMGKVELADWLGRTVFHQLGKDLNESIEHGLKDFVTEESTEMPFIANNSLQPIVEAPNPSEWSLFDSILYALILGLILTIFALCMWAIILWIKKCIKKRKSAKKMGQLYNYESETTDESEDDKFDIRDHYPSQKQKLIPGVKWK